MVAAFNQSGLQRRKAWHIGPPPVGTAWRCLHNCVRNARHLLFNTNRNVTVPSDFLPCIPCHFIARASGSRAEPRASAWRTTVQRSAAPRHDSTPAGARAARKHSELRMHPQAPLTLLCMLSACPQCSHCRTAAQRCSVSLLMSCARLLEASNTADKLQVRDPTGELRGHSLRRHHSAHRQPGVERLHVRAAVRRHVLRQLVLQQLGRLLGSSHSETGVLKHKTTVHRWVQRRQTLR